MKCVSNLSVDSNHQSFIVIKHYHHHHHKAKFILQKTIKIFFANYQVSFVFFSFCSSSSSSLSWCLFRIHQGSVAAWMDGYLVLSVQGSLIHSFYLMLIQCGHLLLLLLLLLFFGTNLYFKTPRLFSFCSSFLFLFFFSSSSFQSKRSMSFWILHSSISFWVVVCYTFIHQP